MIYIKRAFKQAFCLLTVISLWASAQSSIASESVDQLLSRLAVALQERNYRGDFIYEYGTKSEILHIAHGVYEGNEFVHMYHVNGLRREFSQEGLNGNCKTLVGQLLAGRLNVSNKKIDLETSYQLVHSGQGRIANRDVEFIDLLPKDNYRYGLSLAVDRETALPLRSLIVNQGRELERIQFVNLDLDFAISELVDEGLLANNSSSSDSGVCGRSELDSKSTSVETHSTWSPTWIPSGFVKYRSSSDALHQTVQNYTDGVTSFTVFISSGDGASGQNSRGLVGQSLARRGATVAFMSVMSASGSALRVTVVGEVPAVTAKKVSLSVAQRIAEASE